MNSKIGSKWISLEKWCHIISHSLTYPHLHPPVIHPPTLRTSMSMTRNDQPKDFMTARVSCKPHPFPYSTPGHHGGWNCMELPHWSHWDGFFLCFTTQSWALPKISQDLDFIFTARPVPKGSSVFTGDASGSWRGGGRKVHCAWRSFFHTCLGQAKPSQGNS